jgi:hypothetical protein
MSTEWWQEQGYLAGKEVGGGMWICLVKMLFTYRLMLCDEFQPFSFYCYPHDDLGLALEAFEKWGGEGDPIDGWVKHHPSERRRPVKKDLTTLAD